ncbi:MAG: ABC transporter permease [Clostridia bacterium]|jgi:ABC-2 type transport system permease protein|nr:ABC transporter permease [Clostridia bacterium]
MKDLLAVVKFTIKEMIKRKSFIISNIIILLLIVIGFNVPRILTSIKTGSQQNLDNKILIIDEENIFKGTLETLNNMELENTFEIENKTITQEQIKEKIDQEEIHAALIIKQNKDKIDIKYVLDSAAMEEIPADLINIFSKLYTQVQISKLGLTQEQLQTINANFDIEIVETNENPASGNIFAIMLLSLVLFYAIYFCAYQVSSSITTEKTSKIIETLVTSTTPRTIVLGKTLGIGIIGLIQVGAIILVSVISCKLFLDSQILNNILDLSKITPLLGILVFIYFILGYSLYSLLYALTGSTVSKPEDINSANSPIAVLAVIGFYLSYFSMMNPTSSINIFASIFPFSAPFSMPFRVMMGTATIAQIILSIIILLISIIIIAHISIKIYSSAILNYGTKLSIKDIFKIYKDKNN